MHTPVDRTAVAEAARSCTTLRHAQLLAAWLGDGKPVTAKRVLRRADVPRAAHALEIDVPKRVRTAADLPELDRPWTTALDIGLIAIDGGQAVPGPAVASWPETSDEEVLDGWSRSLVTVLAATFDSDSRAAACELGRIALAVLSTDPPPAGEDLLETIQHTAAHTSEDVLKLVRGGFGARHPAAMTLAVLSTFGAITGGEHPTTTELGLWVLTRISTRGTAVPNRSPDESVLDPDSVYHLTIKLTHIRPPCWRRVLAPSTATLGDLHKVIQIALEWDDDHLHLFTVGRRRFGNPDFDAEGDEDEMTLAEVFSTRTTLSYVYDLGDDWRHEITLHATRPRDPTTTYPTCTGGRGDSPVEDWVGEGPDSIPFDQAKINNRLAASNHAKHRVG